MARPRKNVVKNQNSLLTSDNVVEIPVEEQPYPLPEGWKWVRLGDALHLQAGKNISARNIHSEKTVEFPYPCFGGNGIRGYVSEYNREGYFPLIGRQGALCGNIKFVTGKFYATEHAVVVSNKLHFEKTWVSYCLQDMNLNQYATATAQPGLAVSTLNQLPFPYPPIDEQQRIVDCIESLFAKLDEAREKAESVLDGFESRKAAILHKAFTGELTAKWREEHGVGTESWKYVKLSDVSKLQTGIMKGKKYIKPTQMMPYLRVANVQEGYFDLNEIKEIEIPIDDIYRYLLKKGDVLFTEGGDFDKLGRGAVWNEEIYPCTHQNHIFAVRTDIKRLVPKFLSLQARSTYGKKYFLQCSKQTTNLASINSTQLKNFPLILPSLPEQQEIVRILDILLEKERQVKEAAEDVLERIDLMKKAILAKAFRGELTR